MFPWCWWLAFAGVVGRAKRPCSKVGAAEVKWNQHVAPNAASGPWHEIFRTRDEAIQNWTRAPGDPHVKAFRRHLEKSNCIQGLEVLAPEEPNYVARAAELFRRDGFVVVQNVLNETGIRNLRSAVACILGHLFQEDPEGSFGGGAAEFGALIDLPATTPVLHEIFGSGEYLAAGAGGDVALAGALEYQALHMDAIWGAHVGKVQDLHVPPVVTVNFAIDDLTPLNGPMRKVPGSHRWTGMPPPLEQEPEWMRLSTLCPVPAGAAIFRDNRCWHGGTPNLSDAWRALPNLEFFAPGGSPSLGWLDRATMPFETWSKLSPTARYIARGVVAPPGHEIHGMGEYSPGAILDIMPFMKQ